MIVKINSQNPQKRLISLAKEILEDGGIIIYPTDTVYAYGCDINKKKAIEKIYRIKRMEEKKPLSFIFAEFSTISSYARNVSNQAYKIMKKLVPGPYTFIFKATKLVPKVAFTNQKTIGIRIPDNNIALELVRALGRPIISTSVNSDDGSYIVDPEEIEKKNRNLIDLVLDSGPMVSEPSTIIDFSEDEPVIIRQGKGEVVL